MTACIQLLTAFLGSLGFALLFNIRGNKLLPASLGGLLSWGVYLLAGLFTVSDPLRYLVAAIAFTLYAEILARVLKTPATLFLVSSAIPLIPGGSLYRTMEYAMQGDGASFGAWGLATLLLAASIAAGILLAMAVFNMATHFSSVRRVFFK
ncbi:MAG: threonine/serine exporter family protein [Clostridiaceae bacterium]|nr:threonine/serine exporter family protein [Clostridiaceae bacterium]